jgi:formamidopyrimidine-DNA glycosylase
MPELPEVETVKLGLNKLLPGKTITKVNSDNLKSFPNSDNQVAVFMIGATVKMVSRRAKVLIIELSSNYSLVIHLKMTGQLVFKSKDYRFGAGHPNDSLIGKLPDNSTRVEITFEDGSKLFFNDQRKFGWMKLIPSTEVEDLTFIKKLGPEPLDNDFTWQIFKDRILRRKNSLIKPVIMDQSVIAGVGNIYADESLWMSKVNPMTRVGNLTDAKIKLLHHSIIDVLKLSIDKGGSTDRNYVNADGVKGSYIEFAKVFRRDGQPCPRCGRTIIKIWVAGRGTHYCKHCQRIVNDHELK